MELETEIIPLFFGLNDLEERIIVQSASCLIFLQMLCSIANYL